MSSARLPDTALADAVREETAQLVMSLHRLVGDLDLAEEAVQEAVVEALQAWRRGGVPDRPGAWLHTAARRNALDRLRRESRYREKLALIGERALTEGPAAEPDDRLRLLFTCCHPALSEEARLALTLRAVVGLTTAEIARAFLTSEATIAQRIVRAKRKIVTAGIALRVPEDHERGERLSSVLTVVALAYNESHLTTSGTSPGRGSLARDAIWLATLVATSLPGSAEALGLLALLKLQHAREPARFAGDGSLVLLPDQDRSRWDRVAIREAEGLLERAAKLRAPGRFQLQAAIAACHAEAPSWESTDWLQILTLYDVLARLEPSPVVRLNRAVAISHVHDAGTALTEVDALRDELDRYHLLHATRASLLRTLGRGAEARDADVRALELAGNAAERRLLELRLAQA